MYIIVQNEEKENLAIVKDEQFGQWLEEQKMGIVDFTTQEDICSAIVGKVED